ncbi:kinase-like domain-containing protein [Suillus subaureus]|uniref:Kinase-like domain-containing protein n=1 Tax=Suillus subaureus TaxID=48587 RepID=A0A9P7ATP4_9AGAM|nr:kinase-like domain-containing protein [Suillus subaureus]KAG1796597.1 kinase-like domain-containing protein [Suillus subaureus]
MAPVGLFEARGRGSYSLEYSGSLMAVSAQGCHIRSAISARPELVIFLAVHANSVIHDDFDGRNVLICGDDTACVSDFGLSLMYSEVISTSQASWTSTLTGNMRWIAPELFVEQEDGFQVRPSEQSDIDSFGGIMSQILTNKIPHYYLSSDAAIVLCILVVRLETALGGPPGLVILSSLK